MTEHIAIYLYGSKARGDFDMSSDSDILVVGRSVKDLKYISNLIPTELQPINLSFYYWEEIKEMTKYGSLFLQHLKLEGKCIYEGDYVKSSLSHTLSKLGKYKNTASDLHSFSKTIEEAKASFVSNDLLIFDLSVLATVIRHCSILGCWLLKAPCFKRIEPIKYIIKVFNLNNFDIEEYIELYKYKLYVERQTDKQSIKGVQIMPEKWINNSRIVVNSVKGVANE